MRNTSLKTCLLGCVALGLCACPPVRTPVPRARAVEVYRPYTLMLDGQPLVPRQVYSLHGEPEKLRPGDVVVIGDVPLVLGEERHLRLVSSKVGPDLNLYAIAPDSTRHLTGMKVAWDDDRIRSGGKDALARLSTEELRGLRGLHLEAWPPGTEKQLQRLGLDHVCLSIRDDAPIANTQPFPVLPVGLQCLLIRKGSWGTDRLPVEAPLARLTTLRVLSIESDGLDDRMDARRLGSNKRIRVLRLRVGALDHAEALKVLAELHDLDLRHLSDLRDIGFVSGMKKLVRLDLLYTYVESLAPLEGLRFLRWVDANATAVTALPVGAMPALRVLKVLSAPLSRPAVARFLATNPLCEVDFDWVATLRRIVSPADRLRVRTGGSCDGEGQTADTLYDELDPAALAEFLDLLDPTDGMARVGDGCCGHPSIDLYQGNRLLASLSIHHAKSVRWSERWPGDLYLTDASADRLVAFLARRGVHEPTRDLAERRADSEVNRRREACIQAILPMNLVEPMRKAETPAQAVAVLAGLVPEARATMVLKLLGCDDASWEVYAGQDRLLIEGPLAGIDAATFSAVLRKGLADPALANGAARAFFSEQLHGRAPTAELARVLPTLARVGLSHPKAANRHLTLKALSRIATAAAKAELLRYLQDPVKPRRVDEAARREPRGHERSPSQAAPPLEGASELAHAAYLLAELGDRASLPLIRAYAGTATGADRTLLLRAVSMLEQPPPHRRPVRGTKR